MDDLDKPYMRDLVALLLLLPGDWQHPVWRSLSADQGRHNVFEQISPFVRMLGRGEGRPADALVYEVLDVLSAPSEETRKLLGEALGSYEQSVRLADVWLEEVLATATRARAGALPGTLRERATWWGKTP